MSAEGMLEVAFIAWGNVNNLLVLLITLISSHLIVAYVVGAKLTRVQVVLISMLYIGMSGFVTWGAVEMSTRAAVFEATGYSMATGEVATLVSRGDVAAGVISAFALCIFATLKFMWDIRHPKKS
jgi:hypothetical protein